MRLSSATFTAGLLATCLSFTSASPSPVARNNDMSPEPLPYNTSAFSHPEFLHHLPRPSYEFLFHLQCDLGEVYPIGDGPFGNRKAITFTGGRFEGPKIKGDIM
jgi:hypothetical protein